MTSSFAKSAEEKKSVAQRRSGEQQQVINGLREKVEEATMELVLRQKEVGTRGSLLFVFKHVMPGWMRATNVPSVDAKDVGGTSRSYFFGFTLVRPASACVRSMFSIGILIVRERSTVWFYARDINYRGWGARSVAPVPKVVAALVVLFS